MGATDTRNRILDAAEVLFGRDGISSTSLRAITKQAGANLASVHYHFGSKEALLDAVLARRAQPFNEARLERIRRLVEAAPGRPLDIEEVLAAYIMPAIQSLEEAVGDSEHVARLLVRIEAQPPELVETLFRKNFGEVNKVFLEHLQAALPHLSKETVAERFRFALGTVGFIFSGNFELDIIRDHSVPVIDLEARLDHALYFLSEALRAPELPKIR
jgi:AcrR family transcriptional regulator